MTATTPRLTRSAQELRACGLPGVCSGASDLEPDEGGEQGGSREQSRQFDHFAASCRARARHARMVMTPIVTTHACHDHTAR